MYCILINIMVVVPLPRRGRLVSTVCSLFEKVVVPLRRNRRVLFGARCCYSFFRLPNLAFRPIRPSKSRKKLRTKPLVMLKVVNSIALAACGVAWDLSGGPLAVSFSDSNFIRYFHKCFIEFQNSIFVNQLQTFV